MSEPIIVPEGMRLLDPANMNPALNPTHVVDGAGLQKVGKYFQRIFDAGRPSFTIDTEFNVVPDIEWHKRRIRTIQVGDRDEQFTIDLLAFAGSKENLISGQGDRPLEPSQWAKPIVDVLRPVLDSNAFLKIGHMLQAEYEMLSYNLGIYMWHLHDTYLAEKLIWAGAVNFNIKGFWGLEDLVRRYMKLVISKEEQKTFDLETPLTERQLIYTALDCRLPYAIYPAQSLKIEQSRQQFAMQIDNDAIPAFGDMRITGFLQDREAWQKLNDAKLEEHKKHVAELDEHFIPVVGRKVVPPTDETIVELQQAWEVLVAKSPEEVALDEQIREAAGKQAKDELRAQRNAIGEQRKLKYKEARDNWKKAAHTRTKKFIGDYAKMEGEAAINYGSTKQLLLALHKMRGFTKDNLKDTSDRSLTRHRGKPVIDAVVAYRKSGKKLESFGENYYAFYNEYTGRIHSYINLYGAETGRTTSSKPNIQQIPKEKEYRKCFIARPGYKIITMDYEGCELRIIADFSGDIVWIEAFRRGEDIHSVVGEMMFRDEWTQGAVEGCAFVAKRKKCDCPIHKDKRDKTKPINFGTAYGMTEYKLSDELGVPVDVARMLLQTWDSANPTIAEYLDESGKKAKMAGECRTGSNRRRLLPKPDLDVARKRAKEDILEKYEVDREPTSNEITHKLIAMLAGIERQGRNTPIQGTNADMAKLALGCGFDDNGVPYEWHYLRPDKGNGFLVNMVHDEQVIEAPEDKAEKTREVAGDAMIRAGARFVKSVPMTYDYHIENYWTK